MFYLINSLDLDRLIMKFIIIYIYSLLGIKRENNSLLNNYLNSLDLIHILYIFIYSVIKAVKSG